MYRSNWKAIFLPLALLALFLSVSCGPTGRIILSLVWDVSLSFSSAEKVVFEIESDSIPESPLRYEFDFADGSSALPPFPVNPEGKEQFFWLRTYLLNGNSQVVGFGQRVLPFISTERSFSVSITKPVSLSKLYSTSDDSPEPLPYALFGHRAVTLPDGMILIVGGTSQAKGNRGIFSVVSPDLLMKKLLLYNPKTGDFFYSEAELKSGRIFHTVTLLPDGRVLIAGGLGFDGDNKPVALKSIEIYDYKTDKVLFLAQMRKRRYLHTATLLSDGTLLFVGGLSSPLSTSSSDTDSNPQWSGKQVLNIEALDVNNISAGTKVVGEMVYPPDKSQCLVPSRKGKELLGLFSHRALPLADDLILIAGGMHISAKGTRILNDFHLVLKREGNCWKLGKVGEGKVKGRFEHSAAVLEVKGRRWAVVLGGRDEKNNLNKEIEFWNQTGNLVNKASFEGVFGAALVPISERELLLTGGFGKDYNLAKNSYLLKLEFSPKPTLKSVEKLKLPSSTNIYFSPAVVYSPQENRYLIVGGANRSRVSNSKELNYKFWSFTGQKEAVLFTPYIPPPK